MLIIAIGFFFAAVAARKIAPSKIAYKSYMDFPVFSNTFQVPGKVSGNKNIQN